MKGSIEVTPATKLTVSREKLGMPGSVKEVARFVIDCIGNPLFLRSSQQCVTWGRGSSWEVGNERKGGIYLFIYELYICVIRTGTSKSTGFVKQSLYLCFILLTLQG